MKNDSRDRCSFADDSDGDVPDSWVYPLGCGLLVAIVAAVVVIAGFLVWGIWKVF